jgi:glycosyltransferase involved in cell wall biosynthesis
MKKKLLFITSRPPYPLVSGQNVRAFGLLRMLSLHYHIDLLTLADQKIDLSALSPQVNQIVSFKLSKATSYLKTLWGLLTNFKPLQVNYYYSSRVQQWINEHFQEYDVIFCNNVRTAEYVKNKRGFKILDYVDSIAMNYHGAYHKARGVWKLIYALERKRLLDYEKAMLYSFDKKMVTSKVDKDFILQGGEDASVSVVQNFVAPLSLEKTVKVIPHQLGFFGKMNYEPNIRAAHYFCEQVFPDIKKRFHDSRFVIIGTSPSRKVRRLSSIHHGVTVTGYQEFPHPVLASCELIVAPMISGAGIQNKILESMALGKCVVTTKIGAEGLICLTGNELVVCDTATEMSRRIIELLEHPDQAAAMGNHARRYIEQYYSYQKVSRDLFSAIQTDQVDAS